MTASISFGSTVVSNQNLRSWQISFSGPAIMAITRWGSMAALLNDPGFWDPERYEVAEGKDWPQAPEQQVAALLNIEAKEWGTACPCCSFTGGFALATLRLETRYGERWFIVWFDYGEIPLLIYKERSPEAGLMLSCELEVAESKLVARFHLLSGRPFAMKVLEGPWCKKCRSGHIYAGDVANAAHEAALEHNLIESDSCKVHLMLPGFRAPLPGTVPLWQGEGQMTQESLELQLARWRKATAEDLAAFADELHQGDASEDEGTEEETATDDEEAVDADVSE